LVVAYTVKLHAEPHTSARQIWQKQA
jgi:hypothetical protein